MDRNNYALAGVVTCKYRDCERTKNVFITMNSVYSKTRNVGDNTNIGGDYSIDMEAKIPANGYIWLTIQ